MADLTLQNPSPPGTSFLIAGGLYWTGSGWSAVMSNPYFGTQWQFYQSPIRGLAGPASGIATELANLDIPYSVSDEIPPGTVNRAQAFAQGVTPTDAVTSRNTGLINSFN